ncbi:MAG: FAD-dependent thymidylate synthase [Candidatus Shapirobacteria bacterium]|nr:FAD-dependent thymidylate synthase [Candidatus Shapirobacteria bacterium]
MPTIQTNKRRIYTLNKLKPEITAVTFAKCSRSPDSFKNIAKELTEAKSSAFNEKYVVGYGHGSVAEHATLHMAIENVSILATKVLEDNRLGSYTEKSTRYQVYDRTRYYKPKNIMRSEFGKLYKETMNFIFDTYCSLFEPMKAFILKKYPKGAKENDMAYNAVLKSRTCDNIRYLLPTATLTNLGMTTNARVLEHAIVKLLSNPLDEMKQIGEEVKSQAIKVTPTLLKYAQPNPYLVNTTKKLEELSHKILPKNINPSIPVQIVNYDQDAENRLITALLYNGSNLPYNQIWHEVKKMSQTDKENIIDEALKNRSAFDAPIRELEHVYYTFDILMDYGAFRDIQRHRMCTQTNQDVTIDHGFDTPPEIIEAGLKEPYLKAINKAVALYQAMSPKFPKEAQYAVPLAFRKRVLFTWNLRELHHFISLRSTKKGHISYRRIAQACWQQLNEIHPLLAKYIRVDMTEGSSSWAASMYKQVK